MSERVFNPDLGDRVARKPGTTGGSPSDATTDWGEAVIYATERARKTGRRQRLRRSRHSGWWLVLAHPAEPHPTHGLSADKED